MLSHKKIMKILSRGQRNNMTEAEIFLWEKIRRKQLKGLQFHRQKIIGNCIVDFYCPQAKLIIEVDGIQHYSESGKEWDIVRDDYMNQLGLRVLRFSNKQVLEDIDTVVEKIRGSI